ncbi:transcription intermediary factor 1-beta-like [Ruditapes philippinarum]|uniref:transcription intermediary factor 1-beta-like n=1 Tax=Ruditapes philippinarum TaxID=129788 RepID=UPI00295BB6C5|nr:transcription intermediary factor 1-beta-like [Ruditapes philippinarum]
MADSVSGKVSDFTNQPNKEVKSCSLFCDPCYQDGENKEAAGFCVECQHYLCDHCFKYHCLPKTSRHHKLLTKSEMPKRKVDESLSETCSHHEGEMVKFYCKTHETVGCSCCMIIHHKPCLEICTLTDIAKDVVISPAYKEFCTRMETTKTNLEDQIKTARENIAVRISCRVRALFEIKKLQQKINMQFELQKQELAKEAEEKDKNEIRKLKQVEYSANDTKNILDNLKEDFQILEETKQSKQLFVALKKNQEKLKTLEQKVADIQKENKVDKYCFIPNKFLTSMLKNVDALGELCVQSEGESEENLKSFYGNYPEYGMPRGWPISNENVIILDTIYNRVRLYSKDENKLVTEKELTSCPWDIAAIGENKFAFTLPNERKIKIMSVEDKEMKEEKEIMIGSRCESIHFAENKLYVACTKPAEILTLDTTGTGIIRFDIKDQAGEQLFQQPAYISFNDENQLICVSDRKASCIVTMGTDGEVQNVFRNEDWKMPLTVMTYDNEILTLDFERINMSAIDIATEECQIINKFAIGLSKIALLWYKFFSFGFLLEEED